MNSSNLASRAIKRVLRDLAEVAAEPLPGVSLCMPDHTSPFKLHGNIEIKDGIYEGLLIHLVVHIPEDYPVSPPAVNISPGLQFGHKYHHHIYDHSEHGNSICTDLTSNFAGHFSIIDASGKPVKSGWTPAYTLSSVLMQLQVFFADPDMPKTSLPSQEEIAKLRNHIKQYKIDVKVSDGNDSHIVTHSFDHPFPPLNEKSQSSRKDDEVIEAKITETPSSPSTTDQSNKTNAATSSASSSGQKEITPTMSVSKTKSPVFDWDKPIKKVTKEEAKKNKATSTTTTVTVRVIKVLPEPPMIEQQQQPVSLPRRGKNNNYRNRRDGETRRFNRSPPPRDQNNDARRFDRPPREESKSEPQGQDPPQNVGDWGKGNKSTLKKSSQAKTQVMVTNNNKTTQSQQKTSVSYPNESCYKPDNLTPQQIKKEISNKLICSVSKVNIFDQSKPILGYPIDLEKDPFGRYWPTPIMEILSYDAFVMNIQQNFNKLDNYHGVKFRSSFGSSYNYWLPVYIDDEHFERSKQYILNSIAIIYAGVEGKKENDFQPAMVLKVLPPILVKTAIHFLKGTIHQSLVGIDTYCQLYRLFVKLVESFPEIQEAIDREVANFCAKEENRHKRVSGDLGEFLIKLSLSSNGIHDTSIMNLLMKEHLTRQVSWTLKKDRMLASKEKCPSFLERFMSASEISNQFLIIKLETAKLLLDEDVKKNLDQRCGLLNDQTMKMFREKLNWIQKNVKSNWENYVEGIGQKGNVYNDQVMLSYVLKAFDMARYKGYMN